MTTRRPPPRTRWPPRKRGSRALLRFDIAPAADGHRAARSYRSVAACSGDTKAALAAEDALHAASQATYLIPTQYGYRNVVLNKHAASQALDAAKAEAVTRQRTVATREAEAERVAAEAVRGIRAFASVNGRVAVSVTVRAVGGRAG